MINSSSKNGVSEACFIVLYHFATIVLIVIGLQLLNEQIHRCFKVYYDWISVRFRLKGPPVRSAMGSIKTLKSSVTEIEIFTQLRETYGKVYIVFLSIFPAIFIADLDLVNKYRSQKNQQHLQTFNSLEAFPVWYSSGSEWTRVRALIASTLTSTKIKLMYSSINVCVDDLLNSIDKYCHANTANRFLISTKKLFRIFSIDVIGNCCCSYKIFRTNDELALSRLAAGNEYVKLLRQMCRSDKFHDMFWHKRAHYNVFENKLKPVILARRVSRVRKHVDQLQFIMDAKLSDGITLNATDALENHHANITQAAEIKEHRKYVNKTINDGLKDHLDVDEIVANAFHFSKHGQEAIEHCLRSLVHALAKFQEIQQKLYTEIRKLAIRRNETIYDFNYEQLAACTYLDAVISESLRVNSPILLSDRTVPTKELTRPSWLIKQRTWVWFLYQDIHRNKEYFNDPINFIPERFFPENRHFNKPGSYAPFGAGTRRCPGMRFSLAIVKLTIAKLLINYKLIEAHNGMWPVPTYVNGTGRKMGKTRVILEPRIRTININMKDLGFLIKQKKLNDD